MDWAQIILGLLTVLLAVFVIAAVILIIFLIKLSRQIKTVSSSMGQAVKSFDDGSKQVNRMVAVTGLAKTVLSKAKKRSKAKRSTDSE